VWRERCEWGGATTLLSYFDDDFADVGVGFHVLVRLHDVIEREPPVDDGLQHAGVEVRKQRLGECLRHGDLFILRSWAQHGAGD